MKIGIVGAGHVGSTAAYTLVLQGIGSELVLVDQQPALAQAQVMDILHATPFSHPVHLRAGQYADLQDAALVIVAAGVSQQAGESRLALLQRNADIFGQIIPAILRYAPDAVLLIATNPLDIMTQVATRIAVAAGADARRVLGTGTMLDTARFRALLGQHCGVAPGSVHAYVLGEHGDSEVLLWSSASVAGVPLSQFAADRGCKLDAAVMAHTDQAVRRAAYQIIEGKGATYYGIGAAIALLSRCILFDERQVLTVSSVQDQVQGVRDVALSLPQVVGRAGILQTLHPPLDSAEQQALVASAQIIREHVAGLVLS